MKTKLKDRVLWFDGTNQVNPDLVPSLILSGVSLDKLKVTSTDADVDLFNLLSDENISSIKTQNLSPDMGWNVPEAYLSLDFDSYMWDRFSQMNLSEPDKYKNRLQQELLEVEKRNLSTFFKTVVYVISTFKEKQIVWGVGRGSSCACLILFIIGLHYVDPVKYNIDITEFFHD